MKERLKKIREDLGKTQKEMSAFLGLGEITWQNYERGISKPKLAVLEKLTSIGYNISWITTGIGNMNSAQVFENNENNFTYGSNVDKSKLFNLVLNELENIYTEEILKTKQHNFLSLRAFDITMNISNLADDNITAVNMVKLMICEENNRIKNS